MKQLFLVSTLAAIFSISASAQTPVSFGVKGGATFSTEKIKGQGITVNTESKVGYYAGLLAEIVASEKFSVQPEVIYNILGAKYQGYKDDLSYISIPLLLKYKTQGLSLVAGPQLGILVSAKADNNGTKTDIKDQFKSTDFAVVLGAGYTTLSGFGFDARYQIGVSNIASPDDPVYKDVDLKNSAFTFGIHYIFNYSGK